MTICESRFALFFIALAGALDANCGDTVPMMGEAEAQSDVQSLPACSAPVSPSIDSAIVGDQIILHDTDDGKDLAILSFLQSRKVPGLRDPATALLKRYHDLISELNITVLQCTEGIERLSSILDDTPYVINAMISAIGGKAVSCNLNKTGVTIHTVAPATDHDVCVVYCGESDCPAALSFASHNKKELGAHCNTLLYLQGGSLCFLERHVPVNNHKKCLSIVAPHQPEEFTSLAKELGLEELQCNESVAKLTELTESSNPYYVINAMLPVFGEKADACSLAGVTVKSDVPSTHQDMCVIYCGESNCPIALSFLKKKRHELKTNCGRLLFLHGGARCLLEEGKALKNTEQCRQIVAPDL